MKAIIKWTNKYSKETGYVGSVSNKKRCFHNSDLSGAKQYGDEKSAKRAITQLTSYGEAENNDFEIVAV
jgi:hypothetical protein